MELEQYLKLGYKIKPYQDLETDEIVILINPENGYEIGCFTNLGLQKQIERSIKNNNLDLNKTFQKFETNQPFQKTIKKKANDFLEKNGWAFAILGQTGCGKSHISDSLLIQFIKKHIDVIKINWIEQVNFLKFNQEQINLFLKKLNHFKVVAIDDFWKTTKNTPPTDIEVEIGYMIINFCYNNKKKLIINSEKTIEQIRSFDRSVAGRIIEMSGDMLINISICDNKNYREVNNWSIKKS